MLKIFQLASPHIDSDYGHPWRALIVVMPFVTILKAPSEFFVIVPATACTAVRRAVLVGARSPTVLQRCSMTLSCQHLLGIQPNFHQQKSANNGLHFVRALLYVCSSITYFDNAEVTDNYTLVSRAITNYFSMAF